MPLYALDEKDRIVAAHDANPRNYYHCLECHSPMQTRYGLHRQPHFYHLQRVRQCRLHSASSEHLIIQAEIQKIIPEIEIEKLFGKILRIADLCWEEKKIIFEIQCSPIDAPQVQRRAYDYAQEGYALVWLLDDRLYNRKRALRPAESLMRQKGCYYFSMHKSILYDQLEVIWDKKRLFKGPPLPINLKLPAPVPARCKHMTQELDQRTSRYYFSGDLFDRALRYPAYLQHLQELEENCLKEQKPTQPIKKVLFTGLELLLRHYCGSSSVIR